MILRYDNAENKNTGRLIMDTLTPLLTSLQAFYSRGQKKGRLFTCIILAFILPVLNGKGSNVYRKLLHLLHVVVSETRFYRFMAGRCFRWQQLHKAIYNQIPEPLEDGRILAVIDDTINPKSGRKIFGCEHRFDHAAKKNQCRYPWGQNYVQLALLKRVHGRWAALPLFAKFYHSLKVATEKHFKNKIVLTQDMIKELASYHSHNILAIVDTWFGNFSLYEPMKKELGNRFHMLSMLRKNSMLYDFPEITNQKARGRPKKYGKKLGSVRDLAVELRDKVYTISTFIYGKAREVQVYGKTYMSKSMQCPIRVVFAYYKNHHVALFTTDLTLTDAQIVDYYSARWKIESGFKELKHDIGSKDTQARNEYAVINHLNMCMLSITIIWIAMLKLSENAAADFIRSRKTPFTFSQARKYLLERLNFDVFYKSSDRQPKNDQKSWLLWIMRMVV